MMESTAAAWSRSSTVTRVWWPLREIRSSDDGPPSQVVRTAATLGWWRSGTTARSTSPRKRASPAVRVGWLKMRSNASGRFDSSRSIRVSARLDSVPSRRRPLSKPPPCPMNQSELADESTDRASTAQRCRWTNTPQDESTRDRPVRPEGLSALGAGGRTGRLGSTRRAGPVARRRGRVSHALLGRADGGWSLDHGPGDVEHGVAAGRFILKSPGEGATLDVLDDRAEASRDLRAIQLERAREPAEQRRRAVIVGRAQEAPLAKAPEHRLHLARHVHFQHQRLGRDAGLQTDFEGHHDRRAQERTHGLLDEEVEDGLLRGAHLDRARVPADARGQPAHSLPGPPAAIRLDPDADPEALARPIARARRRAVHAGRNQQHIDGLGRSGETEGQAVSRAKGDGGPGPKGKSHLDDEHLRDHLVRQKHPHDVVRRRHGERHDLEPVDAGLLDVYVVAVADPDVRTRVAQVQRGGTTQMAVAEHDHHFSDEGTVGPSQYQK